MMWKEGRRINASTRAYLVLVAKPDTADGGILIVLFDSFGMVHGVVLVVVAGIRDLLLPAGETVADVAEMGHGCGERRIGEKLVWAGRSTRVSFVRNSERKMKHKKSKSRC